MRIMKACEGTCSLSSCPHKEEHKCNDFCKEECPLYHKPCKPKEKKKEMSEKKFRQLKTITGKELAAAGACEGELEKFIHTFGYNVQADFKTIMDTANHSRGWIAFLFDKGFIDEFTPAMDDNEVVAVKGDVFTICNGKYILAATIQNHLGLINIKEGTRWNDAVLCREITKSKFREMLSLQASSIEDILKTKERMK